ncbi:hypothetical protein [Streptomyces sp. NPDC050164]|uniref:hypothetical protein n=1 Tax=Streptomyces sp. NPDC050164 TaxID=3365605 RepID=UPI0037B17ABC
MCQAGGLPTVRNRRIAVFRTGASGRRVCTRGSSGGRRAHDPPRPRPGPPSHRYALILEGLARPAVRAPLSRAQDSLISWAAQWPATLGSPEPQEHCRVLFDYLDGMMFHQVVLPRAHFGPEPGIRLVLGALLQRWGPTANRHRPPLGPVVKFPSSARSAGPAASGACSRRAGRRPSYWLYVGLCPVRRECVHGVAGQAGI